MFEMVHPQYEGLHYSFTAQSQRDMDNFLSFMGPGAKYEQAPYLPALPPPWKPSAKPPNAPAPPKAPPPTVPATAIVAEATVIVPSAHTPAAEAAAQSEAAKPQETAAGTLEIWAATPEVIDLTASPPQPTAASQQLPEKDGAANLMSQLAPEVVDVPIKTHAVSTPHTRQGSSSNWADTAAAAELAWKRTQLAAELAAQKWRVQLQV
jgi:hypothetical protein